VITFQAFLRIIHSLRSFTAAVARFVTAAAAFSRLTIGNSSSTTAPVGSKSLRDDDTEMSEEALRRRRKRGGAGGGGKTAACRSEVERRISVKKLSMTFQRRHVERGRRGRQEAAGGEQHAS